MMPAPNVTVPSDPGRPLVLPHLTEWEELAYTSQARSFTWQFSVAGTPYGVLVGSFRRRLVAQARRYTDGLDGKTVGLDCKTEGPDGGGADKPIVCSGHQPGFWHPGIWFKNALVQTCASRGMVVGLNVVVDSDALSALTVPIPVRDPGLRRTMDQVLAFGREIPFELMPPLGVGVLSEWLARVSGRVGTLRNKDIRRNAALFGRVALEAAADAKEKSWSFADFATAVRRRFERRWGRSAYLELPLSTLCGSEEFRHFFLDVVERREEFVRAHNAILARYRSERGLRGKTEPFPDLRQDEARKEWELPFWFIDVKGRSRRQLWAKTVGATEGTPHELLITAETEGESGRTVVCRLLDDRSVRARQENFRRLAILGPWIRPKAVTLTMFLRLFVADLFVHGVGGARYDAVTDGIIRSFFGVEPPPYAVASATWWLPEPVEGTDEEEVRRLAASLRDFYYNPDRHLTGRPKPGDTALLTLVRRKKELVDAINGTGDRRLRRVLAGEIRDVNSCLAALLADEKHALSSALAEARCRAVEARTVRFREYPYFLFSPEDVLTEAEAMWTKARATTPGY